MTVNFKRIVFTWLLLTAGGALTSGQDHGFTVVTMAQETETTRDNVTMPELTSLHALLKILHSHATASPTVLWNQTEETTGLQTVTPKISSTKTQTAATFAPSTASSINILAGSMPAAEDSTVGKSTATAGTAQASSSTEFTMETPKLSISTQSLDPGKTSTFRFTRSETPDASTRLSQPTTITSTASIKTEEGKSDGTSRPTSGGGGLTPSTASYKTSAATAAIPIIKPKKKTDPAGDEKKKPNAGTNHGKVVAGIIGGALLLMMVGFLVIYLKKRKLQKQKMTTTDWAGPSPFLESGSNNGHVSLRSSTRISLSSFLPQRMSKRLSLLPEMDEEMVDMTPATTFGSHSLDSLNGQKVDGNGEQEINGSAPVVPEVKSTEDSTEVDKTSSQTDKSESTNNNTEVSKLNQIQTDNPSDLSEVEGNKQ